MRAQLEGALPIYAKLLTQNMGISLTIGGCEAFTTGGAITIPDLPPDNEKAKIKSYGYIMHESGHEDDTDFDIWPKEALLQKVTNWFEDVRTERLRIKRYPGARKRLLDLVNLLVEEGGFSEPTQSESPAKLLSRLILYRLRSEVLGQKVLQAYADKAETLCLAVFPASAVSRINAMMFEVENCNSTQDCIDLSQSILDMLKEEEEKAKNSPPPPTQPQGQNQEPPPQNQAGQGNDDNAAGEPGEPSSGPAKSQSDPSQGDPQSSPQGQAEPDGNASQQGHGNQNDDDGGQSSKGKNIQGILDGSDNEVLGDLGRMLEKDLNAMHHQYKGEVIKFPPSKKSNLSVGQSAAILNRVESSSRALKRRVVNLLEGIDRAKRLTKSSGSRLDTKRLYRLQTSDFRVFEKKIEGVTMNTAVQILVDASTSMKAEGRITIAADAALALQNALEGVKGLSTAVAAFPANVNGNEDGVLVVSEFGESTRKSAPQYAALLANGLTPLAEAMLWAGSQLAARKEERKILLVVTDGYPETRGEPTQVSRAKASKIKRELDCFGIETMGLGIKIDVSWLFGQNRTISDIKDLPQAMFAMMQNTLLRKVA